MGLSELALKSLEGVIAGLLVVNPVNSEKGLVFFALLPPVDILTDINGLVVEGFEFGAFGGIGTDGAPFDAAEDHFPLKFKYSMHELNQLYPINV